MKIKMIGMYKDIHNSFLKAIQDVGMDSFKKCSIFARGRQ